MSETLEKCTVCHGLIDEEDLFCGNCGTEAPHKRKNVDRTEVATHNFSCDGCGASMSYDASAQNLRCPFCASESMELVTDQKVLAAKYIVPLKVSKEHATSILKKWMSSSFWRPSDLAERAVIVRLTPVYVPFWKFSVETETNWTADTSRTPAGARGDWYPMSGEHRGKYHAMLVGASSALTPTETRDVLPFDFSAAIPRHGFDLENVTFEQFRVQRKYARPLARTGFEQLERDACAQYVPGRSRNVHVNVRFHGMSSEPVLLPFWIMAYRYKGNVYRFLLNGQTGKATGSAPTSWLKVGAVVGGIAAILALILLVMSCGGLGAALGRS